MSLRVIVFVLLVATAGCFSPMPPPEVRYFEPALQPADAAASTAPTAVALRVRRVRAAAHLKERMVWRESDVEFGFSEGSRWAEMPATYADRALAKALFGKGDLVRTDSTSAPTLVVELRSFEELRTGEASARAELAVLLYDADQRALVEKVFRGERKLSGTYPEDVAASLGSALDEAVAAAAEAVRDSLYR